MNQNLSTMYPLSQDQVGRYQRDGHILLKNVASQEEVKTVRPLILGIVDEVVRAGEMQGRISDYSKMFTHTTNVWRGNEVFHPGQKPGELAASDLNPLLFSRP